VEVRQTIKKYKNKLQRLSTWRRLMLMVYGWELKHTEWGNCGAYVRTKTQVLGREMIKMKEWK
jgi:hypothetical protein